MRNYSFLSLVKERVVLFDGAMGTTIQNTTLNPDDFQGYEGLNEILNLTKPEIIKEIHNSFLCAGCDVIETNSFSANGVVLKEYGIGDKVYEINKRAAEIAKEVASGFSREEKKFVSGSIGPGTKLPSLGDIFFDELFLSYKPQIQGLIDGGVDILQVETCQDILQAKIACIACFEVMKEKGKKILVICSVTIQKNGKMLLGTEISSLLTTLSSLSFVDIIGINCCLGPLQMVESVKYLSENSPKPVIVLPNAGLPEIEGERSVYKLSPQDFSLHLKKFVTEFGVEIVGGCCGTTPEHIKTLSDEIKNLKPKKREVREIPSCSSPFISVSFHQIPKPLIVGERTNATGSKVFRDFLLKEDFDAMVDVAKEQGNEGAHLLDLSLAYSGRNEVEDMKKFIKRIINEIENPFMIDSTDPLVIEESLKLIGGKPIINSINLEDGGGKARGILELVQKYGTAVVALTIDEEGMAIDANKKIKIAERIVEIAEKEFKIQRSDIFIDPLTFTIASGDETLRNSAKETLKAISLIKEKLKGVWTILGVSNLSYGLNQRGRKVLNAVFLNFALKEGLDGAIINAGKIIPVNEIIEYERELAKNLIFNDWVNGDPLFKYIEYFSKKKDEKEKKSLIFKASSSDRLMEKIIKGEKRGVEIEIMECLKDSSPERIINSFIIPAIGRVGEFFEKAQMPLPFVLRSAEVTKISIDLLKPYMKKIEEEKGVIVLATVKGDVHDIGKNLCDIIISNNGFKVINLGIRQPLDDILYSAIKNNALAIGLSGLLVQSVKVMKEYILEMERRGVRFPVILGGAALTGKFVEEEIKPFYKGEVFYAKDAFEGLKIVEKIRKKNEK